MSSAFHEVSDLLQRKLAKTSSDDRSRASALQVVSVLSQPARLVEFLESLRTSQQRIADCARISYRHPLGFDRIVLIDSEPAYMLRIHVWWPAGTRGVEHVHNHRFGFASSIVHGGYEMEIFRPDRTGFMMDEYEESLTSGRADWKLASRGARHLRLMTNARLFPGSSYWIAADTLHRITVPVDSCCITLFLVTAIVGSTTQVFAEPGSVPPSLTRKNPMTSNDYNRRLDALIECCSSGKAPKRASP